MINLLPPEEKEKLFLEKKKKITIILGIIFMVPLFCMALLLLSTRFYILGEISTQSIVLEQAKKTYQTPNFLIFKQIIESNNDVIGKLRTFYQQQTYMSDVLKTVASIDRPEGVYLTNLSLVRDSQQKVKANVVGFSDSRDNLLVFQKNIQENQSIENANFLPQSWVDSQNVRFYLNFEIKK